jgi:4-amino-4-deoxy-L-arabinose transferase-like glycosyltransferase
MCENLRCQLWIAAAAALIFFTNLGSVALFDMDEALYSTCAREMFQRGDWVVPWFNGEMFPEKPPLMFWTMMAGFELFGVNELGARFFSAVLGVATALATFHLGRLLFGARVGCWAGLIVATTIIFTVSARAATVDMALTFVTTVAFLLFAMAKRMAVDEEGSEFRVQGSASDATRGPNPEPRTLNPEPSPGTTRVFQLRYAVPMYACIGVAVLGKGPVGMVLPLAAMGLYLLVVNGWWNLLRSAWWMRPFTAIVVVAAVAVPWYVLVGVRTDGEWLRKFFIDFNLRPFKQPIQGHGGWLLSYLFHIPGILFGFFPWAVFLGPTLVDTVQRLRRKKGSELFLPEAETGPDKIVLTPFSGCVLASCWFGVWFVFWSICKTKLPHYLLPAYPALALLTACFVDRWLSGKGDWSILPERPDQPSVGARCHAQNGPVPFSAWWLRNAWISMILVGMGIMIAIPIVAAVYLPGEELLGLVGLIPALGGMWCWWKTARNQHQDAAVAFAVTSVLFLTALFGFAALRIDQYQNAKPMIAAIRADSKAKHPPADTVLLSAPPIATYRFFRESTVFYAGYPVTKCDNDEQAGRSAREELRAFVANSGGAYVITTDEYAAEIAAAFPGVFREILRQRRFLGPGEMVVLGTSP